MPGIGIIGAGFGAQVHVAAWNAVPGCRVVALADSGSGRAARQAGPGLRALSDWRRLLDDSDVDVVVVATPPDVQVRMVIAALESGRHILCEKPCGLDLGQARAMLASVGGATAAVGFQFRFEPGIAAMRDALRQGVIGTLSDLEVSWLTAGRRSPDVPWSWQNDAARGGGVVNAFGSHVADLLAWLSGGPVAEVLEARTRILVPRRSDGRGGWAEVTAEDHLSGVLRLAGGATARVEVTNCAETAQGMRITASGPAGVLTYRHRPPFRFEDMSLILTPTAGNARQWPLTPPSLLAGGDSRIPPVADLARRFVGAMAGEVECDLPRLADGVAAMQVLDDLRRVAAS